jgi:hypothetical protein
VARLEDLSPQTMVFTAADYTNISAEKRSEYNRNISAHLQSMNSPIQQPNQVNLQPAKRLALAEVLHKP